MGRTLFATLFSPPTFFLVRTCHMSWSALFLEAKSIAGDKPPRCLEACLSFRPGRSWPLHSDAFCFSPRRHQLLRTSALQPDKAASIDPQSLTADTFIRRRWRPRRSPGPIKESALPTGAAGSERLLAGQIRSRLEPRSAEAGSLPACVIARQLCRSQMIHDKRY